MKKFAESILSIFVGVLFTGWVLDEAGQGKLGNMAQSGAKKVTRGFGDGV